MRLARSGLVGACLLVAASCGSAPRHVARSGPAKIALFIDRAPNAGRGVRVDLYLPAPRARPPPLAIFVEGAIESTRDGQAWAGPAAADVLRGRGLAVAWLRFAVGEDYPLARCAADVAAAIRDLRSASAAHGFDASRVVLVGYEAGASLSAIVALDRGLGAAAGLPSGAIGGVVGLRGTYDLSAITASASSDAPPFLLLAAADDAPEWAQGARRFARALERSGAREVATYVAPHRNARTLVNFAGEENQVTRLVTAFVATGPSVQPIEGPWGVQQRWGRTPPLDSSDFWKGSLQIVSRPIDERFRAAILPVFQGVEHQLHPWPLAEYHAVSLRAFLASRAEALIGRGDHLVVTNIQGERLYLTRADLDRHDPAIVVGIDDERNLFRIATSYQLAREYSWRESDGPMPIMIRPLGAFVYFPNGSPPELRDTTLAAFGLTPLSFRLHADDPLRAARGLSPQLRDTLLGGDGCLKCHSLRGTGARAHHVRAVDGQPHGGFALPLEEYSAAVLHRFLFHQEAVAARLGVDPLLVDEPTAKALYALVAPGGALPRREPR